MFDWKILAASFAALLVVSSVLVGGFGFEDIFGQIRDFVGESPLDGLMTSPMTSGSKQALLSFSPESFSIDLDKASFTAGQASFSDFTGTLLANLTGSSLELAQADSDFRASLPLTEAVLDDVRLPSLSLEETSFQVESNSLDTSGTNVSLEASGFSGTITITPGQVQMDGNFTSIKGNSKAIV